MPPSAQVGFAAKLASEKPNLDLYKPVSAAVLNVDAAGSNLETVATQPASNPFGKTAASGANKGSDVFADLKVPQASEVTKEIMGVKRTNPFSKNQTSVTVKQRKLK